MLGRFIRRRSPVISCDGRMRGILRLAKATPNGPCIRDHAFQPKEILVAYFGSCFCGAVKLEVTGSPEAMGYCHCRSCRSWSGGPVNAFSLWKPDAVHVTAGGADVAVFQKNHLSPRTEWTRCGGRPVMKQLRL